MYRLDRVPTGAHDLEKGGIMIVCSLSLNPEEVNIPHPVHQNNFSGPTGKFML